MASDTGKTPEEVGPVGQSLMPPLACRTKFQSEWVEDGRPVPPLCVRREGASESSLGAAAKLLCRQVMFDDEAESYPGPSGQWDALSCEERMRHAPRPGDPSASASRAASEREDLAPPGAPARAHRSLRAFPSRLTAWVPGSGKAARHATLNIVTASIKTCT